jgi:antitoxin (DNA-binding transcriptional repressor) of toxin-antitoxin stability system
MIKVNIHQAKTHLSEYLAALEKGEIIVLCKRNVPIAEIRAIPHSAKGARPIGLAKGTFEIPASFFEPLPADIINSFYTD